jgi:predicted ATP-grasp superfamily ATP-dependent carboligase
MSILGILGLVGVALILSGIWDVIKIAHRKDPEDKP